MSSSSAPVIARSVTSQRHRVRLTHASTGATILGVGVAPMVWPPGWFTRIVDGNIFIAARDDAPAATVPFIDVVITDGVLLPHLELPALMPDQPEDSVRVPLTGTDVTQAVPPADMTLTVVLTAEGPGGPSTGKTVTVRPSAGAAVPLPETATPGTYACLPRAWDATFNDADLRIGTTTVRKVSMDFTRSKTRIYVVGPT